MLPTFSEEAAQKTRLRASPRASYQQKQRALPETGRPAGFLCGSHGRLLAKVIAGGNVRSGRQAFLSSGECAAQLQGTRRIPIKISKVTN